MTTHKEECEKNELILRQRQEIARLTMELGKTQKVLEKLIDKQMNPPVFDGEVDKPTKDYGGCPTCGQPGVSRERRPKGNDTCRQGHKYPSSTAIT